MQTRKDKIQFLKDLQTGKVVIVENRFTGKSCFVDKR